jgi:hypothetical protein
LTLPSLPLLLALVALRAVAGQVFQPASRAAVPALVRDRDLEAANSAIGFGTNGSEALGPLLAAALFSVLSVQGVLLVDAATFFASAATLASLPSLPPAPMSSCPSPTVPAWPPTPPDWGRVYARLTDQNLSVGAFKEPIRDGRTMVTNSSWLDFDVNGRGPSAVLDLAAGDRLDVRARARGVGAERLTLVGPDGIMAEGDAGSELRMEKRVEGPTWISAVARGAGHPNTLDESVLAHTSSVYVDVAGQRVARAGDARWCLDFLGTLRFVDEHGHFDPATRDEHFGDLVAVLDEARSFYRRVEEIANRQEEHLSSADNNPVQNGDRQ